MAFQNNTEDDNVGDFLSDCRIMLRFARRNALALSPLLEHDIATLDMLLVSHTLAPISAIPPSIVFARVSGQTDTAGKGGAASDVSSDASNVAGGAVLAPAPVDPSAGAVGSVPATTAATASDRTSGAEPSPEVADANEGAIGGAPSPTPTPVDLNAGTSDATPTPTPAAPNAKTAAASPASGPAGADSAKSGADPAPVMAASVVMSPSELILKVHNELSMVIAPATALSLLSSEPPPSKRSFVGGMPLIVKAAAGIAVVSAIGFSISAYVIAKQTSTPTPTTQSTKSSSVSTPGAADASGASSANGASGAKGK